jgi:hypothetical protein
MEVAGLVTGVIALVGLFNNAVDCFEYIQIGRNFGKDFQTNLLKLDVARLKLTRWGKAVGISSIDEVSSLQKTLLSKDDIEKAEELIGQILDLFADAEGVSVRYKKRISPTKSLAILDSNTELDENSASLHNALRQLAIQRQGKTGLRQKAKWALYEEKHFTRLIEDVRTLVTDLVEAFPAVEDAQKQLSETEVVQLKNNNNNNQTNDSLSLLQKVAAGEDEHLAAAIAKATGAALAQSYKVSFSGGNNYGIQIGLNSGSINNVNWH